MIQRNGLGELTSAGSATYTYTYTYTATENLRTVTGGGVTETYSYTNTNQPDKLTSYAATGQPTLRLFHDTNSSRAVGTSNASAPCNRT
jgi:hypothetical protein